MELYLLRHAIAVEPVTAGYGDDRQRPLTPEGRRKMRRAAKGMKALGLEFDSIISSPYIRAKATAEIVGRILKARCQLSLSDDLAADGDPKALVKRLAGHDSHERVLLVGHEPYLSKLVARLIAGTAWVSLKFKKGGLCKLTVDHLKFGHCAELEWLLTPRQLEQLA
jgi:phosphohistidine phosphatase